MKLKINKSNCLINLWLYGFLFIATDAFHLINIGDDTRDLLLVFSVTVLGIYYFSKRKNNWTFFKNKTLSLLPVAMCIIASIIPMFLFNQSLLATIISQRHFFVTFLCYFPIRQAFESGHLTNEHIKKTICKFGTIELLIIVLQLALRDDIIFTTLYFSNFMKYGATVGRVGFGSGQIIILSMFFWINDLVKNKNKIINLIKIALTIYVYFVFGQTRMVMAGIVTVVFLAMLLYKGKAIYKLLILISIPICLWLFSRTQYYEIILSAIDGTLLDTRYDTTSIRLEGIKLYLNGFVNSDFVGMGFPHVSSSAAYSAAGFYNNIFLVDNGIFGFVYVYGLFGLIYFFLVYIKQFYLSYLVYKKSGYLFYIIYFVYCIVTSISLMHFYMYEIYGLSLILIICGLECELKEMNIKYYTSNAMKI